MTARVIPVVLVLVLFGGCLGANNAPNTQGQPLSMSSNSGSESRSESTSVPPPVGNVSQTLLLDGCGKGIAALIYVPQALYPDATPSDASWAANSQVVAIHVEVHECARISVGPFERGPIHYLVEHHDNLVVPQSCRDVPGDYTSDEALSQIWLDDAAIVDYLQKTYELPVRFASINVTSDSLGPETQDHWTFGVPGQPASMLEGTIGATDAKSFPVYRLYYFPAKGRVSFLDYSIDEKFEGLGNPLATGKLAPPLIYGSTGTGDAVAYGGPARDGHYSVAFHQFGDDQCKVPR